jgi:hypothetical protein
MTLNNRTLDCPVESVDETKVLAFQGKRTVEAELILDMRQHLCALAVEVRAGLLVAFGVRRSVRACQEDLKTKPPDQTPDGVLRAQGLNSHVSPAFAAQKGTPSHASCEAARDNGWSGREGKSL